MLKLDSFGAFLSLLCAAHCTILPGLLALIPFLAIDSLIPEPVHAGLLIGSIILALGGCHWGFRRHQNIRPLIFFSLGIIMITASFLIEGPYHSAAAVIGSLLLATAHIVNHFLCQSCVKCQKQT